MSLNNVPLVVSGAFEFSDALELVIARAGFLRSSESSPGAMVAVAATAEIITDAIQFLGVRNRVEIAVYNGTNSHVVSGAKDAIDALYTELKTEGIRCSMLKVDQGNFIQRPFQSRTHPLSRFRIP